MIDGLDAKKDETILLMLSKMALLYWRPDFSPGQARQFYDQYVEDLREYSLADIDIAVKKYRRGAGNKFFPMPCDLRALIEAVPSWNVISKAEHISDRRKAAQEESEWMARGEKMRIGTGDE